jgi:hypothetical protein
VRPGSVELARVLELTYTSHSMAPFARDHGFNGPPFAWDEDRRAHLRAELDAWYARAYGLTRDKLRYVLDPADVKGPDYPSETFRVLKKNEIARFGEYRTARLVLAAYDQLTRQPLAAERSRWRPHLASSFAPRRRRRRGTTATGSNAASKAAGCATDRPPRRARSGLRAVHRMGRGCSRSTIPASPPRSALCRRRLF